MDPRKESESAKSSELEGKERKRHFQIVKLEERIAPDKGGATNHGHCSRGCGSFGGDGTVGCGSASTVF